MIFSRRGMRLWPWVSAMSKTDTGIGVVAFLVFLAVAIGPAVVGVYAIFAPFLVGATLAQAAFGVVFILAVSAALALPYAILWAIGAVTVAIGAFAWVWVFLGGIA